MIENYTKKLQDLSNSFPSDVILYPPQSLRDISKVLGRAPGNLNKDLLEFLKVTNGASILDYCFYGCKNNKLGMNLEKDSIEYWTSHNHIAGLLFTFMSTSSGEHFGYLIESIYGKQPIFFFTDDPKDTALLASSLENFLNVFLDDCKESLINGEDVQIVSDGWPSDFDHWMQSDSDLGEMIKHPKVLEVLNSI